MGGRCGVCNAFSSATCSRVASDLTASQANDAVFERRLKVEVDAWSWRAHIDTNSLGRVHQTVLVGLGAIQAVEVTERRLDHRDITAPEACSVAGDEVRAGDTRLERLRLKSRGVGGRGAVVDKDQQDPLVGRIADLD